MTWHNTSHYIASNDVTITWPDPATDIKTSKHFTSKHKTSPPWNGRRLVHSKEMIWASRWSVALRTFYRQILSVLYSSFPFRNFRPRLVRALLVYTVYLSFSVYIYHTNELNVGNYTIHGSYGNTMIYIRNTVLLCILLYICDICVGMLYPIHQSIDAIDGEMRWSPQRNMELKLVRPPGF